MPLMSSESKIVRFCFMVVTRRSPPIDGCDQRFFIYIELELNYVEI